MYKKKKKKSSSHIPFACARHQKIKQQFNYIPNVYFKTLSIKAEIYNVIKKINI